MDKLFAKIKDNLMLASLCFVLLMSCKISDIESDYNPELSSSNIPTISAVSPPANSSYTVGQKVNIQVTMSENVVVSGSPRILIYLDSGAVYATYYSGSSTDTLIFQYNVGSGAIDSDGVEIVSVIDLNSGSIKNSSNNNPEILSFSEISTPAVLIDGSGPTITQVTPPSDGSYITGNAVDFTVTTFEDVDITGAPRLQITLETGIVYANYFSGTGSSSLVFRYIVGDGEQDLNGVVLSSRLFLNGGTIKDVDQGQNGSWDFTTPTTSGLLITGKNPIISSVTPPADGLHKEGANFDFIVTYNYSVSVSGIPRLTLTVDSNTKYATYLSGSGTTDITFRYVVENSDVDLNGPTIAATVDLNGGAIVDSSSRVASSILSSIDLTNIQLVPVEFQIWLDADDAATITESGGDVSAWADKSGEGNDAYQANGPNQPTIVAGQINGRSVIRLDGTTSYLNLPDFASSNPAGEIFIVLKAASDPAATNNQTGLWRLSTFSTVVYNYTGTRIYDHFGSTERPLCNHGDPIDFSTPHIYNVSANSTDWTGRINGTQVCYRGTNVVEFTASPYIGRSSTTYYFEGDFAEIIMFSKTLQASERQHIENYLQNKWGL